MLIRSERWLAIAVVVALAAVALLAPAQAPAAGVALPGTAANPDVAGNTIVYSGLRGPYKFDLSTGRASCIYDYTRWMSQLTTAPLHITGTTATWISHDDLINEMPSLFDMRTGAKLSAESHGDSYWFTSVGGSGRTIFYVGGPQQIWDPELHSSLWVKNLTTGVRRALYATRNVDPVLQWVEVSNKRAVWTQPAGVDDQALVTIKSIDLQAAMVATPTTVCDGSRGPVKHPDTSGDDIVWAEKHGDLWGIRLRCLTDGTERDLVAYGSQDEPAVSGNLVVWTDYRDGNANIWLYDMLTGRSVGRLTAKSADEQNPKISGFVVVWNQRTSMPYRPYQAYYRRLVQPKLTLARVAQTHSRVTLFGHARSVQGIPFAYKKVMLQRSYNGRTWANVRTASTRADGSFSTYAGVYAPTTYYRVRLVGKGAFPSHTISLTSSTLRVTR